MKIEELMEAEYQRIVVRGDCSQEELDEAERWYEER